MHVLRFMWALGILPSVLMVAFFFFFKIQPIAFFTDLSLALILGKIFL